MGGSVETTAIPNFAIAGTIMTVGFIVFIVVGFLSGLGKRLGKNIYNLIAFAVSAIVTAILGSFIYKSIIGNPVVQEVILELLGEVGDFAGALLATGESLILLMLSALTGPLLFLVIYAAVKFLMLVIRVCIPDLNNLMKKKNGKTKVKISWQKRLIGGFIGLFIGASVFFTISSTPMAIVDLAYSATKEVPAVLLEADNYETAESNAFTTFSEEGEEPESIEETLSGVVTGLSATKAVVDPICESFPFVIFRGLGLNNLTESYLNNSSSLEYELHGRTFETEIYSDVKGLLKGAVVFSSYYLLETQEAGLGAQTFSNDKIGEGVYGILRNNFIIETIDPVIKDLIHELCVANFDLTEEETTPVVDSIKLNEFIDMTDSEKLTESKKIAKFFIDLLTAVPDIGDEDSNALDLIAEFGGILDDMASTYSFAKTPGNLIKVFVNGNEEINEYVSHDTLEVLVNNVENKKCTYTQCLINIKAAYKIAVSLVENNNSSGSGQGGSGVDTETLKEEFGEIFNNSNEGVKEVVTEIVENAVQKIETPIDTENVTHTIVKDYFDNIYEYADELKAEAGDDQEKIQEAEEKFKKEAESVQAIVDMVEEVSNGEELTVEMVENFADAVVGSEVVKKTVEDLYESKDEEIVQATDELKQIYQSTPENVKQDIAKALNDRVESAIESGDNISKENIEMLKQILGIA